MNGKLSRKLSVHYAHGQDVSGSNPESCYAKIPGTFILRWRVGAL